MLVAFHEFGDLILDDDRFNRALGREHPGDRPGPGVGVVRQQSGMALGDVQDDRAGLEQGQVALFVGRDLPERLERQMRWLLHLDERQQPHVIGQADFLERPANGKVPG